MGLIRMGPPAELVTRLAKEFGIENFVETGTAYGGTAIWASDHFKKVITTEYCQEIYQETIHKYSHLGNVKFMFGDSRTKLVEIVQKLECPSLFWLDAHWSGGVTYGESDECPLSEEIHIINESKLDHFILIDDARLFTSPPMPPHQIDQWPNITTVLNALNSGKINRYIVIIEDVIIAVPEMAKSTVAKYCQEVNAKAWVEFDREINTPKYVKGIKLISQDIKARLKVLPSKIMRRLSRLNKINSTLKKS